MPRSVWYVPTEDREVVRIQAMKCDGLMQPECKKLCVDPRLTSFQVLQKLLAKAFNITDAFSVSYQANVKDGKAIYLAMVSDWDVDAAFLSSSDPLLRLKIEIKPFEQGELLHDKLGLEDWDIIGNNDVTKRNEDASRFPQSRLDSFTESISNQVTRTVSQVSRVMGLKNAPIEVDQTLPEKAPMSDAEFHTFLDPVGHLNQPEQFRLCVYRGGIEPSLRKVVWRHLLNIYPDGLNGRVRFEYLRMKSAEYYRLCEEWREPFLHGNATDEVRSITVMVKKDVRRTDRGHSFYAGADDNANLESLFNLLVTFALTHPDVSYCQGMSDIASTLLVTQNDEAHAYVCFCGLMRRLNSNFLPDGEAMTTQFTHLTLLLQHHESEFFEYLCQAHAHGLLFCYRWLLLELKREFPFDDALHMLDVLWSSLPPDYPDGQLDLVDAVYHNHGVISPGPGSPTDSYIATCSRRLHLQSGATRQPLTNGVNPSHGLHSGKAGANCNQSVKIQSECPKVVRENDSRAVNQPPTAVELSNGGKHSGCATDAASDKGQEPEDEAKSNYFNCNNDVTKCCPNNCTDNGKDTESCPINIVVHCQSEPACDTSLDEGVLEMDNNHFADKPVSTCSLCKKDGCACAVAPLAALAVDVSENHDENNTGKPRPRTNSAPDISGISPQQSIRLTTSANTLRSLPTSPRRRDDSVVVPAVNFTQAAARLPQLPPPHEFGGGKPFLMFLCLSLMMQQKEHIMSNRLDHNDIAVHFDRLVRKHNVQCVLRDARVLYAAYIKSHAESQQVDEDSVSDDLGV